MGIIKVNDFAIRAENSLVKIDSIHAKDVYGDATFLNPKVLNCIRRYESNIKIRGSGNTGQCISNFNMLDEVEVEHIRKRGTEYPYVHFGAILIGITPLFPNFRSKKGVVHLIDSTAIDDEQGLITSVEIDFKEGPAYFVVRPEHVLSSSDETLKSCFNIVMEFEDIRFIKDREVFSVDVGVLYRMANSCRFLSMDDVEGGWALQEIRGSRVLEFGERKGKILGGEFEPLEISGGRCQSSVRASSMFKRARTSRKRFYEARAKRGQNRDVLVIKSPAEKAETDTERTFAEQRTDQPDGRCSECNKDCPSSSSENVRLDRSDKCGECLPSGRCELQCADRWSGKGVQDLHGRLSAYSFREHSNIWELPKNCMARYSCDGAPSSSKTGGQQHKSERSD
uniref:Movement protein n=1 Tax=Ferraria betaflexivirus 1 TaxID=3238965 RepID=A0AB39AH59_9VIRU